jgi:N-acetylmuramoyl-L-alanine amidase
MEILKEFKKVFFAILLLSSIIVSAQTGKKFKIVLDAGHGAHDFGANYHGFVEKNINLGIVLKLGKILEADPNIEVIYTRNNDTFVDLVERANIANRANANFFVSVHCNANKNTVPYGSETFVMGLSKSKSSLEVAKQENSVITLEEDYKTKYAGYNPNSPESLISATLAQEEYLDQSIELASIIQSGFENKLNRKSRGVAQAPFMVLHKAFMPRVLVETGFISNKEEGAYLDSEEGQLNIAKTIADAVFKMKVAHFGGTMPIIDIKKSEPSKTIDSTPKVKEVPVGVQKETITSKPIVPKPIESKPITTKPIDAPLTGQIKAISQTVNSDKVIFKIQLTASARQIETKPENFKGLDKISYSFENGFYKYMYGETNDYNESKSQLTKAKTNGYGSAFIVAFKKGQRISLNEALNNQ